MPKEIKNPQSKEVVVPSMTAKGKINQYLYVRIKSNKVDFQVVIISNLKYLDQDCSDQIEYLQFRSRD